MDDQPAASAASTRYGQRSGEVIDLLCVLAIVAFVTRALPTVSPKEKATEPPGLPSASAVATWREGLEDALRRIPKLSDHERKAIEEELHASQGRDGLIIGSLAELRESRQWAILNASQYLTQTADAVARLAVLRDAEAASSAWMALCAHLEREHWTEHLQQWAAKGVLSEADLPRLSNSAVCELVELRHS